MKNAIQTGVYLIIDPAMDEETLVDKLKVIVKEKISAIQVWDNFKQNQPVEELILKIHKITQPFGIPILINNQWEYMNHLPLNGIHFDEVPENFYEIKQKINKAFISGLTCNNDLKQVQWAEENNFDYISFCSMFPSVTANSCELINFETVRQAKNIFKGSILLAGGINLTNIELLNELNYDGVAVVSGIMNAENPSEMIKKYYRKFKK